MTNAFFTMKELGELFGVTSHVIGKALKRIGLRTDDGKPSRMAFENGYCDQRWASDGSGYCWAWENEKTIRALEMTGMKRIAEQPNRAT